MKGGNEMLTRVHKIWKKLVKIQYVKMDPTVIKENNAHNIILSQTFLVSFLILLFNYIQ